MKIRNAILATMVAMLTVPAAAAPADVRLGSEMAEAEQLRGGFTIPLIAIIAIILGLMVWNGDDHDKPTSP